MSRRILKIALVLFALGQIAATCQGTETGNPGVPSEQPGGGTGGGCPTAAPDFGDGVEANGDQVLDDLILGLCQKIVACGVSTTIDTCFNALNGPDGDSMTDEFGLGGFTIDGLRQSLIDGTVVASGPEADACRAAIEGVDCGIVTSNVSETDFSGVENIVPGSCSGVFISSPEASADGC